MRPRKRQRPPGIEHVIDQQNLPIAHGPRQVSPHPHATRTLPRVAIALQPQSIETDIDPAPPLLFRYSAVTFNAHRIHYDLAYAQRVEGHPALVVNGGLTALFLLEHFRRVAGAEPASLRTRNRRPLYCGRPARLSAAGEGAAWRLRAENEVGETAVEMEVEACSVP